MIEAETMTGAREGEGSEDDGNIRRNPFMQPPILKVLFEHLPMNELARCRLVSKLWYNQSLSTWRSNTALKFGREGIVSRRNDDGTRRPETSLGEFLDLWDAGDWGSCPFKTFNLYYWNFKAVEQQRFMELVGRHITSLTLEFPSFEGRDNFRRIIYQAFPNLQFLKLMHCIVDNVCWYKPQEENLLYEEPAFGVHELESLHIFYCLPHSMMDLLSHFHKLKSLHLELGIGLSVIPAHHRNLYEAIRLIRAQDRMKLPLKIFDVVFELRLGRRVRTAPSIELLKLHDQLKLPLQRLEISFFGNIGCDLNNEDFIRGILQCHSSTLTKLTFSNNIGLSTDWFRNIGIGYEHVFDRYKPFPGGLHFEKLEKLYITSCRFSDNLDKLRYMPNLRLLEIRLDMSDSSNLFTNSSPLEIEDWTLTVLTDLRLCLKLSTCNMRKIVKWMPNVERLWGLELDDAKFSLVCHNWKNLTNLTDFGNELTDDGVIGIKKVHDAGLDEGLDDEGRKESGPNIINLKNLASFQTRSSKLTSASVHGGFVKLAHLKELSFFGSAKLDDEAKAALKRQNIVRKTFTY